MAWTDIEPNLDRLGAQRVLLTHMGPEMLANMHLAKGVRAMLAEDGMRLEV
jgi:phosphoribosyl 1,2-cyclic phosphodiesterase